jgi:hypothetical protein
MLGVVQIHAFLNYNLTGLYFIGDHKTSKSLIANAPQQDKKSVPDPHPAGSLTVWLGKVGYQTT